MNAKIAFRFARLIVWTGVAVAGAAVGNKSMMFGGFGAATASLLSFAIDAWREPKIAEEKDNDHKPASL